MNESVRSAIQERVKTEPFAQALHMELVGLDTGFSAVEMTYEPSHMDNFYNRAHGGAIFALIDEAFETVGQTDGTIGVALNVNVTYISSPDPGTRLRAEAREVAQTRKTATYSITVMEKGGRLIAFCQALLYKTGKPIPFL
jgi:acyl-CoA thioesterase